MFRAGVVAGAVMLAGQIGLAQAQSAAEIRGEGLEQNVDCRGGDALLEGNGNRLVFEGGCTSLELRGNGNTVRIALSARGFIHLEGNGNRVSYAGPEPRITVRGEGDRVTRGD